MAETLKEHSRQNWTVENNLNQYPGDDNIRIGCLQRIAASLEKIEKPFADLIERTQFYERKYKEGQLIRRKLEKRVAAYKGIINRMKKQK